MMCVVIGTPYLPTVQLQGPRNSVLALNYNMSFTIIHTLDPVMTSHAGQCTCRASVMIASVSVDVSGQSSSTLTVHSEFILHFHFNNLTLLNDLIYLYISSNSPSSHSIHHCQQY